VNERVRLRFVRTKRLNSWEEGLYKATAELLQLDVLKSSYLKEIIEQVHASGPYMAITRDTVFMHARPHEGVKQPFVAFLHTEEPVAYFGRQIRHYFVFGAKDDHTHQQLLSYVSRFVTAMKEDPALIEEEAFVKWFNQKTAS